MTQPRSPPNSLKRYAQPTAHASTYGSTPPASLPTQPVSKSLHLDPRCSPGYENFSQPIDRLGLNAFEILTHESAVEVGIQAIGVQQLFVTTTLNDATRLKNEDLISTSDGRESMRNY